jgi:hypothetical protein
LDGGKPASSAAWHGDGEFAGVLDRVASALERFAAEGSEVAGMRLAGVQVGAMEGWTDARLREHPSAEALGTGPAVLISHYPVLSLALPVAAAGFPHPGDLLDREKIAETLRRRPAPTVLLGGHAHVRAGLAEGPILQLSAGALVEPPYECALIEIEVEPDGGLAVKRRCPRLLESAAPREPIFSPEEESWRFGSGSWLRTAAPEGVSAS